MATRSRRTHDMAHAAVGEQEHGRAAGGMLPWVALGAAVLFALIAGRLQGDFFQVVDTEHYLHIAGGRHDVLQPFASRQLGPLVARGLALLLHLSIERAYLIEGVLALLLLTWFVFLRATPRSVPVWLSAMLVAIAFWPQLFYGLALPDLVYAALLAVLLLLLQKQQWLAAACMMLPLMVARESTSLTLLCLLLAVWPELRVAGRMAAVLAAGVGSAVVAHLTAHSPGNREHLPQFVYLLLKVPWNAVRLFGVRPWSNKYDLLCTTPRWQMPVHAGSLTGVGVCGFAPAAPLSALHAMTTVFGVLPLLALWLWLRTRGSGRKPAVVRFALLYGAISFVLAPLIGVSYERLFGYSWPLVLVALPALTLLPQARGLLARAGFPWKALLALHGVACVVSFLPESVWAAVVGVLAWAAAIALLARERTREAGEIRTPLAPPAQSAVRG